MVCHADDTIIQSQFHMFAGPPHNDSRHQIANGITAYPAIIRFYNMKMVGPSEPIRGYDQTLKTAMFRHV